MRLLYLALFVFALWIAAILYTAATGSVLHAHDAITGWSYSADCCSGQDCTHAHEGEVVERADGYWLPKFKVLIPHGDPRLRQSGDGMFHYCYVPMNIDLFGELPSNGETGYVRCLYVPFAA